MGLFFKREKDYRGREKNELTSLGFFAGVSLGLASLVGGCYAGCQKLNNWEYSSGSRTGKINKVSEKGLFFKTVESQMALEGIVSDGKNVGANVWDFSLDRQARHSEDITSLTRQLQTALASGQPVLIKYIEVAKGFPWRGDTDYFVQSVEALQQAEKP